MGRDSRSLGSLSSTSGEPGALTRPLKATAHIAPSLSSASRFKTSLQFLLPPARDIYAILDASKAADYVVFLLSDETDVSEWGDTLLRCLQGQGIGEVVAIVQVSSPGVRVTRAAADLVTLRPVSVPQPCLSSDCPSPSHPQVAPLLHPILLPFPDQDLQHVTPVRRGRHHSHPLRGPPEGRQLA